MNGDTLLLEESHDLPLVHFQVVLPEGSLGDPDGQEGLTRLSARLLRRGTNKRDTRTIEETIDSLGAELAIETTPSFVRFSGSVIKKSLAPMLELLGEMLREPSFPEGELTLLKRETEAQLVELCDSDQSLVGTHFRRALYRGHPYSRPVIGTKKTLENVSYDAVRERFLRGLSERPRLFGFSGDVTPQEAERLVREHLDYGKRTGSLRSPPPEPVQNDGRTLRIVDKPERTQTQIQIGRLGTHPKDEDHTALLVGNAVFGGAFTARLMRAVRSERGWSYGASSRLSIDRVRDAFSMWTFPAASDAAACIALELELMEQWVDGGISEEELDFAKSYLVKSYAFAIDTADKRLEQAVDVLLYELPGDYYHGYTKRIANVTREEVNAALKARLSPRDLTLCVVATASDVESSLRALKGVANVEVVPYDVDVR